MGIEKVFLPEQVSLSGEIEQLLARTLPGVVQVRSGGRGIGAGVVWDANGKVITNHHVVAQANSIQVLMPDGKLHDASLVSSNSILDLALLKVAASDWPAVPFGDSSGLRVGELVFAIGHPWGAPSVVTAGIISGLGSATPPGSNQKAHYIRSDVRLAPGNSGGPLLNARGEVIGINAMIFGGDLSVAIPGSVVSEWLKGAGERKAYLGVKVQQVEIATPGEQANLPKTGLLVVALDPKGPAGKSGMLVGDVILLVAGKPAGDAETLLDALARGNGKTRLHLLRAGKIQELEVQPQITERAA